MKKVLFKNSVKQIMKTHKRFISILLMAFLGVGFFAGVRATSPDMKKTVDSYFDSTNMYDISIVSTLGLTDEDINAVSKVEGVDKAYGLYSEDVFVSLNGEESIVKLYAYDENINKLEIIDGKLPENVDECVIEVSMKDSESISIGDYIDIRENLGEDEDTSFKNTKLKVVGIVRSPLYISRDRGTTTLGSGKINYYMFVNKENIISDVYTEIDVLVNDAKNLDTISGRYDELIDKTIKNIESIKEERQTARYNELVNEANQKLDDAQKEFDTEKQDAEKKITDAEKEIENGKIEIQENEKKLADAEKELENGRNTANAEFANADAQIAQAEAELGTASQQITDADILFKGQKEEAQNGINQINDGINTINATIKDLEKNKILLEQGLEGLNKINSTLTSLNSILNQYEEELKNASDEEKEVLNKKIEETKTQINSLNLQKEQIVASGISEENLNKIIEGINECNTQKNELENQLKTINTELENAEAQIVAGQNKITEGRNKLEASKVELANKKAETEQKFKDAEKEIADGKKELEDGKKELEDGEKKLTENKQKFEKEIADAEAKLIDAREKVNDIETAKWYILDRYDNAGFSSYSQDTGNVEKLGQAFPIVFFFIAILISLTTMSRMVEEERIEIGTLKALGYNKRQIMAKYIMYSFLASVIGGIMGALFGLKFFPTIIIMMYQMMYDISEIIVEFDWYYAIMGIGIMTLCIVGSTIYTANKELDATPAEMMRPKAPKAGKRVLIERIPFLWNKFNFTQKVTLRNMFRYKKRFLMTVVGICGCTALILAGFGLKDSISKIMDYQYVDIYDYDMLIALKNTLTGEEITSTINNLKEKEEIDKIIPIYMSSETAKYEEFEEETQIFVIDSSDTLKEVVRLKDLKTGEELKLNDDEVIITDKLSQLLGVKVGDEIILQDTDDNEYKVKIGAITEHYISHYIYMTDNLYKKIHSEDVTANVLLAKYKTNLDENAENNLSKDILNDSKIASITLTTNLMNTMNDTLSAMNLVVYILIASAGLLAFIVLYNLSNINISERIRELATIKVLGFYDKEVYNYVTREILLLTIIGIIFGLIFGYLLNSFILGTCEINILRFKRIISPQSYIYAALITIVFTYIVNFITYFSLKKIDMIESLKTVE